MRTIPIQLGPTYRTLLRDNIARFGPASRRLAAGRLIWSIHVLIILI